MSKLSLTPAQMRAIAVALGPQDVSRLAVAAGIAAATMRELEREYPNSEQRAEATRMRELALALNEVNRSRDYILGS